MKQQALLTEFYAVTRNSIYHAQMREGRPVIRKIAGRENSNSGLNVGDTLKNGNMLAVGEFLQLFESTGERELGNINNKCWGGGTSRVVALCKTRKSARGIFKHKPLRYCDRRWIRSTRAVIAAIADDHPVFSVCRDSRWRLPID